MHKLEEKINTAIEIFDEYGNCHMLASLLLLYKDELSSDLEKLANGMENFYKNLMLNNFSEVRNYADFLVEIIDILEEKSNNLSSSNSNYIEELIFNKINIIKKCFITKTDSISFPLEISKWCASKGLYIQSTTIFVAYIGNFLIETNLIQLKNKNLNIKDRDLRKIVTNVINGTCVVSNECINGRYSWIDWGLKHKDNDFDSVVFLGENFSCCKNCKRYIYNTNNDKIFRIKLPWGNEYKCFYTDIFITNSKFEKEIKLIIACSKFIRDVRNALCHPDKSYKLDDFKDRLSVSLINNINYIIEKGKLCFMANYKECNESISYALVDLQTGLFIDIDQFEFDLLNLVSADNDISYSSRIFSIWELENQIKKYSKVINTDTFAFEDFIIWLNGEGLYLDRTTLYKSILQSDKKAVSHLSLFEALNLKMSKFNIVDGVITFKDKKFIN